MNVVRSRIPMTGIALAAVLMAGASFVPSSLEAQRPQIRRPAAVPVVDEVVSVFVPFGPITAIAGRSATARSATTPARASLGQAATSRMRVEFQIPSHLSGEIQEGQPVWTNQHQGLVRFVTFPIRVPNTRTTVGRGAGKGKLTVETRELKVSSTGRVSGRTKVLSEDYMSGFTGAVWLLLSDADDNELDGFEVICIGVNARSGDERGWEIEIPREIAVQVRDVELWHMKSSCGRDRVDAFLDDASKAAKVAGEWAEVYATVKGAGGDL